MSDLLCVWDAVLSVTRNLHIQHSVPDDGLLVPIPDAPASSPDVPTSRGGHVQ